MKFFDSLLNWIVPKNNLEVFSFLSAFKRVAVVYVVLGCVYATVIYGAFIRHIPEYYAIFSSQVVHGYPDDLIVSINDGILTKNISGTVRLYPIPVNQDSNVDGNEKNPHFFVALNETQNASLVSYSDSDAFIFFGKDGVILKSRTQTKIEPYSIFQDFKKDLTLTKGVLVHLVTLVGHYMEKVPWLIVVGIIIFYPVVSILGALLYAIFLGILVMFFSKKLINRKVSFGESYVISLWVMPIVVAFFAILEVVPFFGLLTHVPLLMTVSIILFIWYMFNKKVINHDTL